MALISPHIMDREQTWDPQLLCGLVLRVVAKGRTRTLRQLGGRVIEGFRDLPGSRDDGAAPTYRMSNVGELELLPEPPHFQPPEVADDRCVRAGDLVVTKGVPVRAAIAPPSVFRHPADANCYLIRGLDQGDALWVALCLNQPAYEEYLTRKSGAAIVPRIRMSVLRNAVIPTAPRGVEPIGQRVFDCLDAKIDNLRQLVGFAEKVRREVADWLPDVGGRQYQPNTRRILYGFFSPADIGDSLVPVHVQINAHQRFLRRESGWVSLSSLIRINGKSTDRVAATPQAVRTLQLSDIRNDFTFPRGEARKSEDTNRRIFADPIGTNEVLLSTLVTNPRVTFAANQPDRPVHPTDHWCRLHFRETPGAWAAVLGTPPIHEQLQRLAIGTVQQFTQPATIGRLVLPDIPLETRIKWDSFLRRWQQRQREIDDRWIDLLRECYGLLQQTHNAGGAWTVPPAVLRNLEGVQ